MKHLLQAAGVDAELSTLIVVDGIEICGAVIPGSQAIEVWRRLREVAPAEGHWPLLLGAEEELRFLEESLEFNRTPVAAIIEESKYLHQSLLAEDARRGQPEPAGPGAVIAGFVERHPKGGEEAALLEALDRPRPELSALDELEGLEWDPGVPAQDGFTIPREILSGRFHDAIHLALIPTPHGWEAPAWIKFGNWNACPRPEVHAARLHRWHDRFGAEVVGITHDVIETAVSRPPDDRDSCLRLALEQYRYCDDIVSQGVGSISALAGSLRGGRTWYFWWD